MIARGLIGDPGLEIRMGALRVIVLVILAVIPVVLRVPVVSVNDTVGLFISDAAYSKM